MHRSTHLRAGGLCRFERSDETLPPPPPYWFHQHTSFAGEFHYTGDGPDVGLTSAQALLPVPLSRGREWTWWAHTGGGNALAFKQPT